MIKYEFSRPVDWSCENFLDWWMMWEFSGLADDVRIFPIGGWCENFPGSRMVMWDLFPIGRWSCEIFSRLVNDHVKILPSCEKGFDFFSVGSSFRCMCGVCRCAGVLKATALPKIWASPKKMMKVVTEMKYSKSETAKCLDSHLLTCYTLSIQWEQRVWHDSGDVEISRCSVGLVQASTNVFPVMCGLLTSRDCRVPSPQQQITSRSTAPVKTGFLRRFYRAVFYPFFGFFLWLRGTRLSMVPPTWINPGN